ncbi:MAG: glycosyltransferase family 39 protein [Anaerolineae bacterium]|nr:glycosyltransferase family 39 protein [Anaerolineae bacterium]
MIALTVVSLILLFVATYLFNFSLYVWDAALLLALALGGLFVVFTHSLGHYRDKFLILKEFFPRTLWAWGRLVALFLSLYVAFAARRAFANVNYALLFLIWLVALVMFAVTLLAPVLNLRKIRSLLSKSEWVALGVLLLASALVRGWNLGRIPLNLGGDEGTQLLAGLQLLRHPMQNPFATGWYSVPTMSFFLYGVGMRIWGATIAGGRALSVVVGTLTVLTTFLLGRAVGGRKAGWVAALVVAFSAYHIHFSRLASNQILDPFIGTLSFWLVWVALRDRSVFDNRISPAWGVAGMVAGFGWYAYFGARWVTVLIAIVLGWRALLESRFLKRHYRGLFLFAAGMLVVTLPLWGWYLVHPSAFSERYNAVSIFISGWVDLSRELTGKTTFQSLLEQFWKSVTAFHLTPDPTFWYYPQRPLLDFVTGALMLVGMIAVWLRWNWPGRSMTLIWFWSTLIMAWVLTENPPSSQRGLLLIPAVGLLVAWGVLALEEVFARYRRALTVLLGVCLVVGVVLNLGFYFNVYTPRRAYGNPMAAKASDFARYALVHPIGGMTYFMGAPELYWDFGVLAFLLRDQPGVDVQPGEIPQNVVKPARFVFLPSRAGEAALIQSQYPGGKLTNLVTEDEQPVVLIYDWGVDTP